jgi:hypothetical protein
MELIDAIYTDKKEKKKKQWEKLNWWTIAFYKYTKVIFDISYVYPECIWIQERFEDNKGVIRIS